eukprot:6205175-Pleurochrysis_carterae.AAC.1
MQVNGNLKTVRSLCARYVVRILLRPAELLRSQTCGGRGTKCMSHLIPSKFFGNREQRERRQTVVVGGCDWFQTTLVLAKAAAVWSKFAQRLKGEARHQSAKISMLKS